MHRFKHVLTSALLATLTLILSGMSHATIVQMQTQFGHIEINLFDQSTPKTVANFLSYTADNRYDNTLLHRAITDFIVQGGGYTLDEALALQSVSKEDPVSNEPVYSNVRGTIAMAKFACSPDSATSEWFINMNDNSANLDSQNGGFTVFGQVTEAGMAVLDEISALPTFNLSGTLANTPLQNFSVEDANNSNSVVAENFVYIDTIQITDTDVNSAATLTPALNTLIANSSNSDCNGGSDHGGGVTSAGFLLLMLSILGLSRRATLTGNN